MIITTFCISIAAAFGFIAGYMLCDLRRLAGNAARREREAYEHGEARRKNIVTPHPPGWKVGAEKKSVGSIAVQISKELNHD